MTMAVTSRWWLVASLLLAGASARASQQRPDPAGVTPGRAAAHAALDAMAELPAVPPSLPTQAAEHARGALSETAFGKKGTAASEAHSQAAAHAHDALLEAHTEAATHAAQGAVAAAARAANAEVRAAAGRAQSNAAKSNAASHRGNAGHP